MACPVHIWLPMAAGVAPFARVARDRVRSLVRRQTEPEAPREIKRWAPVGQPPSDRPVDSGTSA